jgi:hypothetical protein
MNYLITLSLGKLKFDINKIINTWINQDVHSQYIYIYIYIYITSSLILHLLRITHGLFRLKINLEAFHTLGTDRIGAGIAHEKPLLK